MEEAAAGTAAAGRASVARGSATAAAAEVVAAAAVGADSRAVQVRMEADLAVGSSEEKEGRAAKED